MKQPKTFNLHGDTIQTQKINITNIITKIEYKLPKVLEINVPSLAEHKKWDSIQPFSHNEGAISDKTEVFYRPD